MTIEQCIAFENAEDTLHQLDAVLDLFLDAFATSNDAHYVATCVEDKFDTYMVVLHAISGFSCKCLEQMRTALESVYATASN